MHVPSPEVVNGTAIRDSARALLRRLGMSVHQQRDRRGRLGQQGLIKKNALAGHVVLPTLSTPPPADLRDEFGVKDRKA
jgi:hypothetical protein